MTDKPDHDPIKQPTWYTSHPSGVECKDIVVHHNWAIGSAIAYLWRAGLKGTAPEINDLRKAQECIGFEIARLETGAPKPEPTTGITSTSPLMGTVEAVHSDGTVSVRTGLNGAGMPNGNRCRDQRAWLYVSELAEVDEGFTFEVVDRGTESCGSWPHVGDVIQLEDAIEDRDGERQFKVDHYRWWLKGDAKVRRVSA